MARLNQFGDTAQTFWQKTTLMASLAGVPTALPADFEDMLEAYYMSNGLYDSIQAYMDDNEIWTPGMQSLYNPAHRAVEFHVAHLWPGPLDRAFRILCENPKVTESIQKVWKWSNWESKKQLAARWYALSGTMFIKAYVRKESEQVRLQLIKSRYVTEFETDSSDFITSIRIDATKSRLNSAGQPETYTRTEVWNKAQNSYRVYEHRFSRNAPLSQLGKPVDQAEISQFGIDFIPIVHAKFKDIGEPRGLGVFVPTLDKIDEANRIATRLHEIAFRFNRAYIGISANDKDAQGRPLPAPRLVDKDSNEITSSNDLAQDESLILLPGMSRLDMMVPNINFAGHLAELTDQMDEIKQDLPELRYYDVKDSSNVATDTVRLMLAGAIDKVLDARGSAYSALIRANQMALTLGKKNGFAGFTELGEYTNGDLDHSFAEQDVLPLSKKERADIVKVSTEAGMDLVFAMKQAGYSEAEVREYQHSAEYLLRMQAKANEAGVSIETLLMRSGWNEEELSEFGTQKLASIKLQQEDSVSDVRQ
jgi:hypothetical protein